jgi:hypothetical protein
MKIENIGFFLPVQSVMRMLLLPLLWALAAPIRRLLESGYRDCFP